MPLTERHLPLLLQVEPQCFPDGWTEQVFRTCFVTANCAMHGLFDQGRLAAYAIGFYNGDDGDNFHLASLAVPPAYQGQGLSKKMLAHILGLSQDEGAQSCTLQVRTANRTARALYHKAGFVIVGRDRGYYKTPPDDAILMHLQYPVDDGDILRQAA